MNKYFNKQEQKTILSMFFLAVLIILFYKFVMDFQTVTNIFKKFFSMISPFVAGFIIAYFLNIPRCALEKLIKKSKSKKISELSKPISIFLTYLLFIGLLVAAVTFLVPSAVKSIENFINNFQIYYNKAMLYIDKLRDEEVITKDMEAELTKILNNISVEKILGDTLASLNKLLSMSSYILNAFLALITSIYFMIEGESFKKFMIRLLKSLLDEKHFNFFIGLASKIDINITKFIYCQLMDSLILGSIVTIEFILFKSPYALLLGVILAICNIVPYFGSIFGSILVIVIVIFTSGLQVGIISAVVLVVTQQIDGNIIQPRLIGSSFSLSPALCIIGISVGGALWGMIGMVIAIPIVSIIKDLIYEFIEFQEKQKTNMVS